mgnify:CR=1 FL=1
MHDAARVGIRERLGHIAQNAERLGGGECAVGDAIAQRLAGHERHGEPRQSIGGGAGGQHRHDMRLLQRRGEPDLAREALNAETLRELLREHLHHHAPLQCALRGHEDTGHASAAEFPFKEELAVEGALKSGLEVAHGKLTENR